MISSITPEQQQFFDELIQQYLDNITKPLEKEKAYDAIGRMYKSMNLPMPKVIISKNPLECVEAVKLYVKENNIPNGEEIVGNINESVYLCLWRRYWDCYYQFGKHIGVQFDEEKLSLFHDFLDQIFFIIPYDDVCFISEPPIEVHWKDKDLHRDGGPSVVFACSSPETEFNLYTLNGIPVPKYLAETPAGNLDLDFFLKEKNADVKAEFVRKFGIDRMMHLGKEVDNSTNYSGKYFDNPHVKNSEYKLVDMSPIFTSIDFAPHLYMKNQTTGIYHLEPVHPDCNSLPSALVFAEEEKVVTNTQEALEILDEYDILDIK